MLPASAGSPKGALPATPWISGPLARHADMLERSFIRLDDGAADTGPLRGTLVVRSKSVQYGHPPPGPLGVVLAQEPLAHALQVPLRGGAVLALSTTILARSTRRTSFQLGCAPTLPMAKVPS